MFGDEGEVLAQQLQSEFARAKAWRDFRSSGLVAKSAERRLELFSHSLVRALEEPTEDQVLSVDLLVL